MTAALRRPTVLSQFAAQREVSRVWQSGCWVVGYPSWDAWCQAESPFTGIELNVPDRRLLVRAMRLIRMSESAIASALRVSKSTIHADRMANGDTDEPETIRGVDGSQRASQGLRKAPEPLDDAMTHTDRAVHLTRLEQDRGLTVLELRLLTDWHHGNASGTMSRVCRQGRVVRTGRFRLGYGVYVAISPS